MPGIRGSLTRPSGACRGFGEVVRTAARRGLSDDEFTATLDSAIADIYHASTT